MNQSKLTIIGLVAGLGLMASANASPVSFPFLVDDFNFTIGATATDTSIDGTPAWINAGTGGNHWGNREDIMADLTSGTIVNTIDDESSQQGIFNTDINSNSGGHGYWAWSDSSSITGIANVEFFYSTNVDNADVIVSFADVDGNQVGVTQWSDLPSTGGVMTPFHGFMPGINNLDIAYMSFDVFSVGGDYYDASEWLGDLNLGLAAPNLDFRIDDLYLSNIPEPSTLTLMGLGLAGLGWNRRHKSPSTAT